MMRPNKDVNILAENRSRTHSMLRAPTATRPPAGSFRPGRGHPRQHHPRARQSEPPHAFDLETAELFSFLQNQGFNVLAFDLRHPATPRARSRPTARVPDARRDAADETHDGREDFILGLGVRCAASSWPEALPEEVLRKRAPRHHATRFFQRQHRGDDLRHHHRLGDDYIRADIQEEAFEQYLYRPFIPLAIRLSASHGRANSPRLAQVQAPVMITRNLPETRLPEAAIEKSFRFFKTEKELLTSGKPSAPPRAGCRIPNITKSNSLTFDRWFTD